ncbi:MAG: 1-deoxy-D-xylulose-5-phosphate reductoisomerase [Deltaproteobacteria bacterium]|nr:1-deoxy-D-xylulose-5-phosphate reductoisomerase [Deltaproteobacteria bacterium]MBW1932003.1 1-deoxy-D-xylulose-5-phosphate reductoisomerase [Deltaproteobacteria bacterium]MBW1937752.1 1-deoxy-D-xylulose-5-phosphate reductoisomerase [Deltaproteobacteria bacterium]MBW1964409.1 1-deoxy-D-xylulose-5-phosphate reductoisomerase [Deltaproteobacteria bacterium]MBW2349775.1 1-deoxy-D-xylulose-5-phosphate reductoisomerase [Deltaproteobacteria bacterium]
MKETRSISLLGSTGSIGTNVLDVVRRSKGQFSVKGLAAGENVELLAEQIRQFRPEIVSVMTAELADQVRSMIEFADTEVFYGKEGYKAVATVDDADLVVSAMVGAAGLIPTLAALEAGKDVALANKESLVAAGPLVTSLAKKKGAALIPIDSEHSAIFQCLRGHRKEDVRRIVLTASGGPFKELNRHELIKVTPEEAVRHPKWSMGAKISVDSATLMNKGLEVIEARWLFDISVDRIDVVVHPQSIVHSMVEFIDGSVLAQMGIPDMRVPISYALAWPGRLDMYLPSLNLIESGSLDFEIPHLEKFPCLGLAYDAARKGGTATTALNSANEVAVEAFLQGRVGFTAIQEVVREVIEAFPVEDIRDLDDVLKADALARLRAEGIIHNLEKSI